VTKTQKLVSLCPSITETLVDFGLEEALVGITKFCIHPEDVVSGLNKVGGTKDPDLSAISNLDPDLIFMNAEENRKEDYEELNQEFMVDVSEPRVVEEVPALLRHFGKQTNRAKKAEQRAEELEEEIEALKSEAQDSHFSYAYFIWRKPWMVVGADTYVSDLFSLAGGQNVFEQSSDRYPTIKLEDLKTLKPQYVFLADEPFPFQSQHLSEIREVAPESKAQLISGDDCCWHGVRSIRGVQGLRRFLKKKD